MEAGQMRATIQVKMSMGKAVELDRRLAAMRAEAERERVAAEKQVRRTKPGTPERVVAETLLASARLLEGNMNTSNLMRLLVDIGLDHLDRMDKADLLTMLMEVAAPIGRPRGNAHAVHG